MCAPCSIMPDLSDIPPGLRALYDAAGPVIRHRLLRDVLGRDDSFLQTAHLGLDVGKLPEAEEIAAAQEPDGCWSGALLAAREQKRMATETAILRLCELGLESSDAVQACLEKALIPTLLAADVLWELETLARDAAARAAARAVVRDAVLRLICRATRVHDAAIRPHLEVVLAEWDRFLGSAGAAQASLLPPTAASYAAVCWYPWSDDDFPRVRKLVERLSAWAETQLVKPAVRPPLVAPHVLRLRDKWEYLARPPLLFHELELAARLGVARDLTVTRWLIEELEARQDADGFFRFDRQEAVEPSWYFPLEKTRREDYPVEWTFRAALVFKLLEYDV